MKYSSYESMNPKLVWLSCSLTMPALFQKWSPEKQISTRPLFFCTESLTVSRQLIPIQPDQSDGPSEVGPENEKKNESMKPVLALFSSQGDIHIKTWFSLSVFDFDFSRDSNAISIIPVRKQRYGFHFSRALKFE